MKVFLIILLLVAVAAACMFFASTGKTKLATFAATCGERALTLEVYRQQHYAYAYHFMLIRCPGIPPVRINQRDVTERRVPYRDDMFDRVPHVVLDTAVRSIKPGMAPYAVDEYRFPFILYLDPAQYTREQFDMLGRCMREAWPALDDSLYQGFISPEHHLNYPQLMTMVYANPSDFEERYAAADTLIRVLPEGRVELLLKSELVNGNLILAGRVPPGTDSIVFSRYGTETAPADFSVFRHSKTGRSVTDDFRIEVEEFKW